MDPCGHGSFTITLTKLYDLGRLDCVWRFQIDGNDGAHTVDRITVSHYCDMDAKCLAVDHNGPVPIEVFPEPGTFAASWNAYVAFSVFRRCDPDASS